MEETVTTDYFAVVREFLAVARLQASEGVFLSARVKKHSLQSCLSVINSPFNSPFNFPFNSCSIPKVIIIIYTALWHSLNRSTVCATDCASLFVPAYL